ncbi:MAG TPA: hypothetical protein IAA45_01595 [Candidatus Blautia gallistercoris]|uniref:ABC-2 family transporter protein n=1 Tax=Candidatus Blautia gallistercoris TaxID=2838490 RepID=A0A9D1WG28_9FIRM|nr:hypothetical protein [Candidatus Blautia gallistercoris]
MRQVGAVVRFNFLGFFRNPRVILTFLLGFVVSFLLSEKVVAVTGEYQSVMQAAEPFIWTFGDVTSMLLMSVLLLLLFTDLPKLTPASPYYLVRMTRRKWLAGQFVYIVICTGIYVLFILLSTTLLCIRYTFPGNLWSETAAMLGYSGMGERLQVPVTIKVMESITPYGCMAQVALLMLGYALTLGFLILVGNLLGGRKAGFLAGLIYSLYGFLLNPQVLGKLLGMEEYEMYKIRVFVGWVSPVNHSVYGMHNFGYDLLPTVGQSLLVFGVLLFLLWMLAEKLLRTYNFGTNR